MRNSTRTTPRFIRLARLAEAQYGVVSTDQLLALGFSRATISRWTAEGRLHRIHRGVYAVGRKHLSVEGRWMAAVLSCGKGAVLSHLTAAAHWDFLRTDASRIDVTVALPRRLAARRGVRVHRSRLDPDERTLRHGIPVTSPMRTMLDLAETVPPNRVRHALEASVRRGKYDRDRMHSVIARGEGRRGLKVLRRLLAELDDAPPEFRSPSSRSSTTSCGRTGCRCLRRTSSSRARRSIATGPPTAWWSSSTVTAIIAHTRSSSGTMSKRRSFRTQGSR